MLYVSPYYSIISFYSTTPHRRNIPALELAASVAESRASRGPAARCRHGHEGRRAGQRQQWER